MQQMCSGEPMFQSTDLRATAVVMGVRHERRAHGANSAVSGNSATLLYKQVLLSCSKRRPRRARRSTPHRPPTRRRLSRPAPAAPPPMSGPSSNGQSAPAAAPPAAQDGVEVRPRYWPALHCLMPCAMQGSMLGEKRTLITTNIAIALRCPLLSLGSGSTGGGMQKVQNIFGVVSLHAEVAE